MTDDTEREGGQTALPIVTEPEEFRVTVESTETGGVLQADALAWELFERFLGGDPVNAWVLATMTHQPFQALDENGTPTGEWKLASSAVWKRDRNVPTPPRVLAQTERPETIPNEMDPKFGVE